MNIRISIIHHASTTNFIHNLNFYKNNIPLNILLEYKGPSPPSGTHRYFFGLFEQQSGQIIPNAPPNTKFNIDRFIKDNNLREVAKVFMTVSANA
jgi:phosphatidylethanolamine-binding protein (PEBP) family uncharacterized protein